MRKSERVYSLVRNILFIFIRSKLICGPENCVKNYINEY